MDLNNLTEEQLVNALISEGQDEVDNDHNQENVPMSIMTDDEEKEQQKESRANVRIRELVEKSKALEKDNQELKRQFEEYKKQLKAEKESLTNKIPDSIDKTELLKKLASRDPDEYLSGIKETVLPDVKKLLAENFGMILPKLNELAINGKAVAEKVDTEELNKIFNEYPSLKNSTEGYKIAKELIKKKSKSRAEDYTTNTSSPSNVRTRKATQGEVENALLQLLDSGGVL